MLVVLDAPAEYMRDVWSIVLIPPAFYVIILVLFNWYVTTSLYLYTSFENERPVLMDYIGDGDD